jgi:hypothetical protein
MPEPRESPAPNAAVPPHPFDAQWYVHVDSQTCGPYSGHEIRRMAQQRRIVEMDLVCREGESAWVQAKNDPIIGAVFSGQLEIRPLGANAANARAEHYAARVAVFLLIAFFAWAAYLASDRSSSIPATEFSDNAEMVNKNPARYVQLYINLNYGPLNPASFGARQLLTVENTGPTLISYLSVECSFHQNGKLIGTGLGSMSSLPGGEKGYTDVPYINPGNDKLYPDDVDCRIIRLLLGSWGDD